MDILVWGNRAASCRILASELRSLKPDIDVVGLNTVPKGAAKSRREVSETQLDVSVWAPKFPKAAEVWSSPGRNCYSSFVLRLDFGAGSNCYAVIRQDHLKDIA